MVNNLSDALVVIEEQAQTIERLRASAHNSEYMLAQEDIIEKWMLDRNLFISPIGRTDLLMRLNHKK